MLMGVLALAVLDVGCGMRKAEPHAVGIDVSPRSAADIVHTDFSPKGTPQTWKRIIQEIERS